ncbi:unnamed protein product, partial [Hapterophycus canaliculatus]
QEDEEKDEEPEEDDNVLGGLSLDDDDDDDEFPTLEDESLPVDESPGGKAQRLRQEQEKAKKRAEKLGILLDSDFEVAAGTAAANRRKERQKSGSEMPGGGGGGEEWRGKMAEERRRREEEEEEEERRARAELKNRRLYGQEMSAIAMGHSEVAKGPGKMMSMGSSSYVVDMLMKDFMDASLDNIAEVVGLVDEWNQKTPIASNEGQDAAAVVEAVAAIEAGRDGGEGGGSGSGTSRRSSTANEKFCTECGVKIPATAKFCSECGTKQETIAA